MSELSKRVEFLEKRIEQNEKCVHVLEVTANHFYSPDSEGMKGWNTHLGNRDKIKKLIDADMKEILKLKQEERQQRIKDDQ